MKKIVIYLTILFSLFLGINSVNAKTETSQSSKYLDLYSSFQDDEEHKNFDNFDKAFKEFYSTYKETYPYYVISFYDKGSYALTNIYLFKENPNLQMKVYYDGSFFNYQMGHYLDTFSIDHLYVNWGMTTVQINANKTYEMYKTEFSKITFYGAISSGLQNQYGYVDWVQNFASLSGSKYYSTKNNIIYYDSNFDITLADNHKYKSNRTNYDVYVDNYYYQSGDIVPSYKSLIQPNTPKIKMSLIEKQEDFTKVNINFSEFDREKYIYLYNFNNQPGLENWHEIINNDYIYKAIINGTLYVQVIDKAKFNETKEIETIVSATYTFSDLLINEDIIDISTISNNSEIEYRYYGSTPAKFYVSSYRYGELPENVNCIVGTGIYECNIFNIMDIQSTYSFYSYAKNEVTGEDVYVKKYGYNDSPGYNSQIYEFYSKEDFTKYPITCVDNTSDCWSNNYYRSFTIDLTTYINSSSQYKSNYIYVYYNANIYDKSWNDSLNRNGTLEDFTEDNIKPPTYQESNSSFIQGFNDWFAPIIELINKKFPIIAQIGTILSSIFVNNHEDITNIEVDLSFLGMSQKYKLIDINAYKDVKDIVFFFEYCSILMIAIPKIIRNIKESFSD